MPKRKHSGDWQRRAQATQRMQAQAQRGKAFDSVPAGVKEDWRITRLTPPAGADWDRCSECGRKCQVNEETCPNGKPGLFLWCDHCEGHSPLYEAVRTVAGRLMPKAGGVVYVCQHYDGPTGGDLAEGHA